MWLGKAVVSIAKMQADLPAAAVCAYKEKVHHFCLPISNDNANLMTIAADDSSLTG